VKSLLDPSAQQVKKASYLAVQHRFKSLLETLAKNCSTLSRIFSTFRLRKMPVNTRSLLGADESIRLKRLPNTGNTYNWV
jgi:hypothetical protein